MISRLRKLPVYTYVVVVFLLLLSSYSLWQQSLLKSRLMHHCYDPREVLEVCYIDYYRDTAKRYGTKEALKVLHERKLTDIRLNTSCHEAMHEIGRAAFYEYGSIAGAYAEADYACWGGYLHGVIEAALSRKKLSDISAESLRTMCDAAKKNGETSFGHFSCVHGIGHALMFVSKNDLPQSLFRCDDLANKWESDNCANGAFMQNLFSKYNEHRSAYLPKDDLHFPCSIAREKDQTECYRVQGRFILDALDWDFSKSFAFCNTLNRAEPRAACASGLGAAVSNHSAYAPKKLSELCAKAASLEQDCLYGALIDLEGIAGDQSIGEKVCESKPDSEKPACIEILKRAHADFPGSIKEQSVGG